MRLLFTVLFKENVKRQKQSFHQVSLPPLLKLKFLKNDRKFNESDINQQVNEIFKTIFK